LHVPGETAVSRLNRSPADRFVELRLVLSRLLHGAMLELKEAAIPLRILLTGFGPFLEVKDNPTGSFVTDPAQQDLLSQAVQARFPGAPIRLSFAMLPVAAESLNPSAAHCLPRLLQTFSPSAVIAMGVARERRNYTIETVPDDAGLRTAPLWRHISGKLATRRGPANTWLADCYQRGHQ